MLAQTSWSQNETGLTQSDHATWFTLPSPVLTTAVRFEGKRTTPPSCNLGLNGADYRGASSTTGSGLECQMWARQVPHTHVNTPAIKPLAGLGVHNYCRNPTEGTGPWCYTMDPSVRWEYCSQIPDCSPPAQPPPAPSSPSPPCFSGGNKSLEVLSSVTLDTDASPDGFNFSSLVVAAGATLRATGSNPLIIHAEAFVDIQGSIDLSGGTGGNSAGDHKAAGGGAGGGALKISAPSITIGQAGAIHADGGDGGDGGGPGQAGFEVAHWSSGVGNGTGGVGVAGGGAGGDGAGFSKGGHAGIGLGASAGGPFDPGVPPGAGGAGHAFAGTSGFGQYTGWGPAGGAAYGDAQLTGGLQGGSGGGGGGNDGDNEEGAGGGGSGGTIYLVAATLRIEGTLTAKGGLGGRDDFQYNGGTRRECCNNGGPGSVGRIRLDYQTVTLSGTVVPPVGHTSALDSDMLSCLPPPPPPPCLGGGTTAVDITTSETLDTDASPDGFSFSSLVVAAGATLRATGSNPLIIHAEAFVDIQGSIDLSGGTGGNSAGDHKAAGGGAGGGALKISAPSITIGQAGAIHADGGDGGDGGGPGQAGFEVAHWSSGVGNGTGGVGVAGGGAGGDGAGFSKGGHAGIGLGASAGGPFDPGVPPGAGGAGHAFAGTSGFGQYTGWGPAGGAAYGDAQLTGGLQGGSGGGGGGNDGDNEEGAGGGGSGGTIYLVAATLRIEGTLTAKGGLGGRDDFQYNGGTRRECCNNGGQDRVGVGLGLV